MSYSDPTTPKELSTVSSTAENGIKDMESALQNLRHVSAGEKTEMGHLRSRLEEQSNLIAVLKKRADEVSERKETMERHIDELTSFKDSAKDELDREQKKYVLMESRFTELAHNHENMIRFKNECKKQNELLRKENANLKSENMRRTNDAVMGRDKEISEIEAESKALMQQVLGQREQNLRLRKELEDELAEYKSKFTALEKTSGEQVTDTTAKIDESRQNRKQLESQLQRNTELREKLILEMEQNQSAVRKERDEMEELSKHRQQLLKEKTLEVKKVQDRVKDAESRLRQTEEKIESEADEYSVVSQTRKLRAQYSDGLDSYDQLTKQFDAYKKHSGSLLEKEKELNSRLQKLTT